MDPATLIEMAQTWLRLAQEEDPSRGSGEHVAPQRDLRGRGRNEPSCHVNSCSFLYSRTSHKSKSVAWSGV